MKDTSNPSATARERLDKLSEPVELCALLRECEQLARHETESPLPPAARDLCRLVTLTHELVRLVELPASCQVVPIELLRRREDIRILAGEAACQAVFFESYSSSKALGHVVFLATCHFQVRGHVIAGIATAQGRPACDLLGSFRWRLSLLETPRLHFLDYIPHSQWKEFEQAQLPRLERDALSSLGTDGQLIRVLP